MSAQTRETKPPRNSEEVDLLLLPLLLLRGGATERGIYGQTSARRKASRMSAFVGL